jgi:hypothetical protein
MEVFMFNTIQKLSKKLEISMFDTISYKSKQDESAEFWRDYYLAGKASTPAGRLAALAEHRDPIIRQRVAENLNIPGYVQRLLVNDEDTNIRLALTTNPSTLVEIWKQLAQDKSELVRFSLARNKDMPVPMLINLTRDKQTNIAGQAQQTIEQIFVATRAYAA